jgi:Holliday junction DNA helicase RuvA
VIGKLKGVIDTIFEDNIILDVNGVGYLVACSSRILSKIILKSPLSLWIETIFSQENLRLFGFETLEEKEWFKRLQLVQGVGAKAALNILSALSISDLEHALATSDQTAIRRAEGVGPKLATRIVTELKDKGSLMPFAQTTNIDDDALLALVNLGYKRNDAIEALKKARKEQGENASINSLLPAALQLLSKG